MSSLADLGAPEFRRPILAYVTDRRSLPLATSSDASELLLRRIAALAASGIDWIQIREKDLGGRDCAALVAAALHAGRAAAPARPPRILVNDRLDVALALGAGGAHLGEQSIPVQDALRLLPLAHAPKDFLCGVSCHSLETARLAEQSGAHYVFFGPVFSTPAKAVYGEPQGLRRLEQVARAVRIPLLAIGGISSRNAASCLAAGAAGIAAIRLFQDAPDPGALVASLRAPI